MLVPAIPYFVVMGALGAGGVFALTRPHRRPLHVAGIIVGIGGCSLALIVFLVGAEPAYVFRGKAPAITWTRSYLFGTEEVALAQTTGTVTIGGESDVESGTWIVNDTNMPLQIWQRTGKVLGVDPRDLATLAPGHVTRSPHGVDHIGDAPEDPRPAETRVHIRW